MKRQLLFLPVLFLMASSFGAVPPFNDSLLIGTWKGTSICQVRPSACNDEIAVYRISKGEKPGTYHIVMNKVIKDKEEDMAEYDYSFDAKRNSLYCYDEQHKITLKFTVKGIHMEGVLLFGGNVYRIIKLKKEITQR
ncbi:MAG: hypothetical protein ABI688_01845 [Bacteroidota bacterium]